MILRLSTLFLLIGFLCGDLRAADAGKIKIPVNGTLGGRSVPAGMYTVEIDETADKPYLRLIQNEKMVATDVAIALPARGSGKTSVAVTKIGRKEFVRIRARLGTTWYFAYLETSREK